MFAYDSALITAVKAPVSTIPDVLQVLQTIDATCEDGDGLKWFNQVYRSVTQAVEKRVAAGGFNDSPWLAELDVRFAALYFDALYASLTGAPCPGSWQAMFSKRGETDLGRIQFALAGMNAHINHDLPFAIVATCKSRSTIPRHGTPQYDDYTVLNTTLDGLIDAAKEQLHFRLLGDPLPAVSHFEDLIAAWNLAEFREGAWLHAENIWNDPALATEILEGTMERITTFANEALLVPIPY
jgi:hypothetical protein